MRADRAEYLVVESGDGGLLELNNDVAWRAERHPNLSVNLQQSLFSRSTDNGSFGLSIELVNVSLADGVAEFRAQGCATDTKKAI